MIYVYWYLAIGAAVLAVVYGAHLLTKMKESESLRDLLETVNPDRKSFPTASSTTSSRRSGLPSWLQPSGPLRST